MAPLGIGAMLDSPVRIKGEMAGVICSEHVGPARQWTEEEESLSGNLADLVSRAYSAYARRLAQEEVTRLNKNLERLVEEKTRNIKGMFRLINQGILTLREGGLIEADYSNHLETIIGNGKLEGLPFVQLLFKGAELGADKVAATEEAIESGSGAASLQWDSNSHLLPTELVRNFGGKRQHLEIDWLPMVSDATDECEKVMVVLRDVTALRELEALAREGAKELQTVERILAKGDVSTSTFLASARRDLKLVTQTSARFNRAEDLPAAFRSLHTIKGNSRTFGFTAVSHAAHNAEQYLSELRKSPHVPFQSDEFNPLLANVEKEVASVEASLKKLVGFSKGEDSRQPVHLHLPGLLNEILDGLASCAKETGVSSPQLNLQAPAAWTVRFFDDGRGYDVATLKDRATRLTNASFEGSPPKKVDEILSLAFISGVSTKGSVSQFAGRGVGLDAVREAVKRIGGDIRLTPTASAVSADGFCKAAYEITFPLAAFEDRKASKAA